MYFIYGKDDCAFCTKAKEELTRNNLRWYEYKLGVDYTKDDLIEILRDHNVLLERLTVPQIFLRNKLEYKYIYIGGYEDLLEYFENHGIYGHQN